MAIVAVHGVPGLSFAEVTYILSGLDLGYFAVVAGSKPVKIGSISTKHVIPIVFCGADLLLKNLDKINFRATAFVCDTYNRLKNELRWDVVGTVQKGKKCEYVQFDRNELGSLLQQDDLLCEKVQINTEYKPYIPANVMVSKFEQSPLSQAQTLMYRVKNTELRSKTFAVVRLWFMNQIKTEDSLYGKLRSMHSNDAYIKSLMDVLSGTNGKILRRVIGLSIKNPNRIDRLAKESGISPFDVRYLMSKGNR